MATVTCIDESGFGHRTNELHLDLLEEALPLRELLRRRIYQEVSEHNARLQRPFQGLILPSDTETTLNGVRERKPRKLSWERQYRKALEAFERRAFLVLVDEVQVVDLDQAIDLRSNPQLTFLKLVPLVGG
jgi:hypothetical protein